MSDDTFENECDRLSGTVDSVQFERVRWSRNEGPLLEKLVAMMRASVEDRPDFELTDEGSKGAIKRFVLKVHSFRVVAISLGLEAGKAVLWGEPIERSSYRIVDGQRHSADARAIDEAWMKDTLGRIFGEVRAAAAA
jgi:hypothetical protein